MATDLDDIIGPLRRAQVLAAAAELGIPAAVAGGARTVSALLDVLAVDEDALRRMVRALGRAGALLEVDEELELTELGERLCPEAQDSLHWRLRLFAGHGVVAPWTYLAHSVRTGRSAWERMGFRDAWDYWSDPSRRAVFHRAMAEVTGEVARVAAQWPGFRAAGQHVVDVGGGNGAALAELLAVHPTLRGTVLDTADGVRGAEETLAEYGDRATVSVGDFFTAVPSDGDVYVLKSVVHDWPAAEAQAILATVAAAMGQDARLVVIEMLDDPISSADDVVWNDLTMLVTAGGRERGSTEYAALMRQAELAVEEIVPLEKTPYSMVVARKSSCR